MTIFDGLEIKMLTELVVFIRHLNMQLYLVIDDDLFLFVVTDVFSQGPVFLVEYLERNIATSSETELH